MRRCWAWVTASCAFARACCCAMVGPVFPSLAWVAARASCAFCNAVALLSAAVVAEATVLATASGVPLADFSRVVSAVFTTRRPRAPLTPCS